MLLSSTRSFLYYFSSGLSTVVTNFPNSFMSFFPSTSPRTLSFHLYFNHLLSSFPFLTPPFCFIFYLFFSLLSLPETDHSHLPHNSLITLSLHSHPSDSLQLSPFFVTLSSTLGRSLTLFTVSGWLMHEERQRK